jgi:hypothetical protein
LATTAFLLQYLTPSAPSLTPASRYSPLDTQRLLNSERFALVAIIAVFFQATPVIIFSLISHFLMLVYTVLMLLGAE